MEKAETKNERLKEPECLARDLERCRTEIDLTLDELIRRMRPAVRTVAVLGAAVWGVYLFVGVKSAMKGVRKP
jgi:hypothetical protein